MRKYIHIAKAVTPVLTEEAANHIAEEYSRLRSQEQMGADIARVSRSMHAPNICPREVIEYAHRLNFILSHSYRHITRTLKLKHKCSNFKA